MIVIFKQNSSEMQQEEVRQWLLDLGLNVQVNKGKYQTVYGLIGDTSKVDIDYIRSMQIVEGVTRVSDPFKSANRKFHPDDTIVEVGDTKIGGGYFQFIAGPCSVESEEQIVEVAKRVKQAGATLLRGGAFKPRTSPYSFQGLHAEGIRLLEIAKQETGLPLVSEVMDLSQLKYFENVDVIQVGARNMQNFELLKELGGIHKPILLKRGLSATIQELLMSAEYIMAGGGSEIILCERGIRTFETYTRNTMDISAIPVLKEKTHLPVIADPSHATGTARLVKPMALAATVAGCDGLMIEVHNDPTKALCDGPQALTPDMFDELVKAVANVRQAMM